VLYLHRLFEEINSLFLTRSRCRVPDSASLAQTRLAR